MPLALPDLPIPYSYWVQPGRLLAGQYPGAPSQEQTRLRLGHFLATGISTFLDLTCEDEGLAPYAAVLAELAAARGRRAAHIRRAIRDMAIPTVDEMQEILDVLDVSLAAGENIYLHCWGGRGRTGTVIGCYLVRHGQTGPQALAALAALRRNWPDPRGSPETEEHALWCSAGAKN